MREEYRDLYRNLGLNIAYYRKKRGMTQEALAEKIGIDQTHMSKIEVASVGVSLDTLFKLSKALDIPPNQFFDIRGEQKR